MFVILVCCFVVPTKLLFSNNYTTLNNVFTFFLGWPKSKKILTSLPDVIIEIKSKKDKGKVVDKAAAKKNKKGKNKK